MCVCVCVYARTRVRVCGCLLNNTASHLSSLSSLEWEFARSGCWGKYFSWLEEVTGAWRKLYEEEPHDLIKLRTGWAEHVMCVKCTRNVKKRVLGHKTILCFCHHSGTLEPTFRQLETMKLDKSPFVIISVVGQELLGAAQYAAAVIVLEAALRIGTCSLKLRGSVFSALSSAYWALNSLDKVHVTGSQVWSVAISDVIELYRVCCWYFNHRSAWDVGWTVWALITCRGHCIQASSGVCTGYSRHFLGKGGCSDCAIKPATYLYLVLRLRMCGPAYLTSLCVHGIQFD